MTVVNADFVAQAEPYRRELLAHCYRMLGSLQEAEDLVQETYLRAWRSFDRFEGRSSIRVWLYNIATMASLTALDNRSRRPLPSDLSEPTTDYRADLARREPGALWLEPAPDSVFGRPWLDDPAAIVASHAGIRLAFIAALQHLPPRQRAVLIFRDVLGWQAAEVADVLETTTASVNSALQRARTHIEEAGLDEDAAIEPEDPRTRDLLDRYVRAFENADVDSLIELLRHDVEFEMPPIPMWLAGREQVVAFLAERVLRRGYWRFVPVRANGQPAAALYERRDGGPLVAHGIQVLDIQGSQVARVVSFNDEALVPAFGLAPTHPG